MPWNYTGFQYFTTVLDFDFNTTPREVTVLLSDLMLSVTSEMRGFLEDNFKKTQQDFESLAYMFPRSINVNALFGNNEQNKKFSLESIWTNLGDGLGTLNSDLEIITKAGNAVNSSLIDELDFIEEMLFFLTTIPEWKPIYFLKPQVEICETSLFGFINGNDNLVSRFFGGPINSDPYIKEELRFGSYISDADEPLYEEFLLEPSYTPVMLERIREVKKMNITDFDRKHLKYLEKVFCQCSDEYGVVFRREYI